MVILGRVPHAIFFLRASTIFVAVMLLSLVFRSRGSLCELPLTEDGYYALSVSRQLALGHGITVDGEHPTNGIQPLFAFLLVPVYLAFGCDRFTSLRGVLAVHWIVHLSTALVLASIVRTSLRSKGAERSEIGFWTTALLWLTSRFVLFQNYNGLETGLVLLLYVVAWRLYQIGWFAGWKVIGLGGVLGMLVLARIDATFLVLSLTVFEALDRTTSWASRARRILGIGLIAFVVSLPWWLYNLLEFGSLMPSSGTAQSEPFTWGHFRPMVRNLLLVLSPYVHARFSAESAQMILQACLIVILGRRLLRAGLGDVWRSRSVRMGCAILVSSGLLCLYYLAYSGATYFYGRYLSPLMVVSVPLAAIAMASMEARGDLLRSLASCGVVVLLVFTVTSEHLLSEGSTSPFYDDQLGLIQAYVPSSETVSAGQSGTIGYFRDRVVNLDGKVNAEALKHRHDAWKYLEEKSIVWYCDSSNAFLGADPAENGWLAVAHRGMFVLYHHEPSPLLTTTADLELDPVLPLWSEEDGRGRLTGIEPLDDRGLLSHSEAAGR
jgi:hypothetical protein